MSGTMPKEETGLGLHDGPDLYFIYRGGGGTFTWHFVYGGYHESKAAALAEAKVNPEREVKPEGAWLVVPCSAISTYGAEVAALSDRKEQ